MEVFLTEFLVGLFALQQVVADNQDGVSYRDSRRLRAPPPFDAGILRTQVAPLGARRCVGRFGEG